MKQCQVCFDDKSDEEFRRKYSRRCRHAERLICDQCVYRNVREAFSKMCTDGVHCPEMRCKVSFSYRGVQKILSHANDRNLMDKYERFVLHRQLEQMSEFIWCSHGCGMGQLNEGKDGNNIVTCIKCHRKTCFIHKTEWHTGLTCHE